MKTEKKSAPRKTSAKKTGNDVIASRRSCDVNGTGLSHYVLMGKAKKKKAAAAR